MPVPCSHTPREQPDPPTHTPTRPDSPLTPGAAHPLPPDSADHGELRAALDEELTGYLRQRCAEAQRLDTRYAHDIAQSVASLVQRGGKRLRPAFLWWGSQSHTPATDLEPAAILRAAAALELIQACALIHDDLMDTSPLRRGAASLHEAAAQRHHDDRLTGDPAAFGAATALLAGDLALVWAEDLWETSGVGAAARRRAHPVWRSMRSEMIAGQYLDLHEQATGAADPQAALNIAHLKSGTYTVERPLLLGAALAGAGLKTVAALRRVGRAAGVAFQLRDDLLGVFGDPSVTGKPAGDDIRHGKRTYLVAVGLRNARVQGRLACEERVQSALGNRALTDTELDGVRGALTETGAKQEVESHIHRLVAVALTGLDEGALAPHAAAAIADLVHAIAALPS